MDTATLDETDSAAKGQSAVLGNRSRSFTDFFSTMVGIAELSPDSITESPQVLSGVAGLW
jgi:hypothetical protein